MSANKSCVEADESEEDNCRLPPLTEISHRYRSNLAGVFASLWCNKSLIFQMSRREVVGRYRGSLIGLAWSFFNPILMLLVYTFVFSIVFKARWGVEGEESRSGFAIMLFVGMIIHGLFAECVNRAPQLIIGNASYVKKVIFPLEVLPWVAMGSSLFHMAISLVALLIVQLALVGYLPWSIALFPFVLLPLVLTTIGFAWFLSAAGVYVRDIGQITSMITMVLLFLSPVFYPISVLPEKFQRILLINPLTFIIEQARQVLIFGGAVDWTGLVIYSLVSLAIAWAGYFLFQSVRRGFADVL